MGESCLLRRSHCWDFLSVTKVRVRVVLRSHYTLRKAAFNSVFLCTDILTA